MSNKQEVQIKDRSSNKYILSRKIISSGGGKHPPIISSPWQNHQITPYENKYSNLPYSNGHPVPAYKTPEHVSTKLNEVGKSPSFKISNHFNRKPPCTQEATKRAEIAKLEERVKSLERVCEQKDKEIDELGQQTKQIIKDRDTTTK